MLDGMIARKQGEVSDFGKLYDPFADTLTQITYFLCFVIRWNISHVFPHYLIFLTYHSLNVFLAALSVAGCYVQSVIDEWILDIGCGATTRTRPQSYKSHMDCFEIEVSPSWRLTARTSARRTILLLHFPS
jgi:phosphatidylglycerophosphate synthase